MKLTILFVVVVGAILVWWLRGAKPKPKPKPKPKAKAKAKAKR